MSEPESTTSQPGDRTPGERPPPGRRLEAPPSERYEASVPPPEEADEGRPSLLRGAIFGGVVALMFAAIIVILGEVFAFTAGLIVVALFMGRGVAAGVSVGAGQSGSSTSRFVLAIGVALAGVAVAQLGLWIWAGLEGGVLGPIDYLAEVFGPLVPLQFLLAGGTAGITVK